MRLKKSEATSPAMREMASPWKIGSNKITAAPTTTAIAVRNIAGAQGDNRHRRRDLPGGAHEIAEQGTFVCHKNASLHGPVVEPFASAVATAVTNCAE